VLTDLDGTLLEPDGSLAPEAADALAALAEASVPVCPITSKTAAELGPIMARLRLAGPAGFENGGGVRQRDGRMEILEGAVPLADLLAIFAEVRRRTGAPARTLLELDDRELGALTGLRGTELSAARCRQTTLPLVVDREWDDRLRAALPSAPGILLLRGNRFLHMQGQHTKATAARRIAERVGGPGGVMVALGDAPNDADLLEFAEIAVIVPGLAGPNPELLALVPRARVAAAAHGRGWAAAVGALLAVRELPGPPGAAGPSRVPTASS